MPAAKQPQDRLPKKTATAKAEAKKEPLIVEHSGITYEIDPDNANNLELFEFIEDEEMIKATRGFLGPEQWKKWKESVRDEQGRVPADGFEDFLNAVMKVIGGSKDDHPNS